VKLVVLLASLLFLNSAGAEENSTPALSFLSKMGNAVRSLNYFGTLIYMHDGQVESIKLVHKYNDKGEIQRIVHLSGEAREVISKDDVVTCYMPDSQSVFVGQRRFNNHLLARLSNDYQHFGDQYTFSVDGNGRVAGRETTNILIQPADSFRYGYRFWVDNDSGLLLKSDLLDAEGQVLEQLMFVDLTIGADIPDEMLKPAINGESYTWHKGRDKSAVNDSADQIIWQIKNLPAGFTIKDRSKQKMPDSNKLVDYMMVSDGLASISVFIEKSMADDKALVGASRIGAINIYGSLLDDHHVTVVGDAPQSTVKMIAESISVQ